MTEVVYAEWVDRVEEAGMMAGGQVAIPAEKTAEEAVSVALAAEMVLVKTVVGLVEVVA